MRMEIAQSTDNDLNATDHKYLFIVRTLVRSFISNNRDFGAVEMAIRQTSCFRSHSIVLPTNTMLSENTINF